MSFASIEPRESAVDACAAAVRQAILRGELAVGARLPPERALATALGVSRLTLRAGLAKLASTGLVAVRHGSGYVVQDFERTGGIELLPGLVALCTKSDDVGAIAADLLRVRRALAASVLQAVAEHPRRGAARRVGAAVDAFAAVVTSTDHTRIAAADLDVVAALIKETGSPVMALCLNPVAQVVTAIAPLREAIYAEPAHNLVGWRALVAWLERPTVASVPQLVALLEGNDRATLKRLRRSR